MNRRNTLALGLLPSTLLSALPARAKTHTTPKALVQSEKVVAGVVNYGCRLGPTKCRPGTIERTGIGGGGPIKMDADVFKLAVESMGQSFDAFERYFAARGHTLSITITTKP